MRNKKSTKANISKIGSSKSPVYQTLQEDNYGMRCSKQSGFTVAKS